ncbi:unnamed protein product, partial [Prorocentrum cordatum]
RIPLSDGYAAAPRPPLWDSVLWELGAFSSLLSMISRSTQVSWSSKVMCADASFWGLGLVCKVFDEKLVGSVGVFSERWRFLGDMQVQSRAWAGITTGPPEGDSKTPDAPGPPEGNSKTPLESSEDFQHIVGAEEANPEAASWPQVVCLNISANLVGLSRGLTSGELRLATSRRGGPGDPGEHVGRTPPGHGAHADREEPLPAANRRDELDVCLEEQGLAPRPKFSIHDRVATPLPDADAAALDLGLSEWMLGRHLEGVDHWRGVQMLAALQWSDPRLGRDESARLPAARQSLRGWKVLTPPLTRLPLPEEPVAALACELVGRRQWGAAVCVVLSMVFNMRPGEWSRVPARHAVPPRDAGSLALRHWAPVLRPREGDDAKPGKTAEFDESFILDLARDQLLAGELSGWRQGRRAARRLKLIPEPMPHLLRHSGASRNFVNQLRPLAEVKRRGRWETNAS